MVLVSPQWCRAAEGVNQGFSQGGNPPQNLRMNDTYLTPL